MARFEQLAGALNSLEITKDTSKESNASLNTKSDFLKQIQQIADEYIDLSKISYENLTEEEREALIKLSKYK